MKTFTLHRTRTLGLALAAALISTTTAFASAPPLETKSLLNNVTATGTAKVLSMTTPATADKFKEIAGTCTGSATISVAFPAPHINAATCRAMGGTWSG